MARPQFTESRDGTQIAFRTFGEGTPLVLVHGSGTWGADWVFAVPFLRERFTAVVIDRRGRGKSGDRPDYSMDLEADDVLAVMSAVGAELLVGHSYGALCSILAAERSTGLRRLVLYEPPLGVDAGFAGRIAEQVDRGETELALETFLRAAIGSPRELDQIRALPAWPVLVGIAPILPRELSAAARWAAPAGPIEAPTLIMTGGETEAAHYLSGLEALEQRFADVRRLALPGQRHIAHMSAPAAFAEAVIDFCA